MAKTAEDALDARVDALMANELSRYQSALDAVGLESGRDVSLQSALDRLRSERADEGALAAAPRLPALELSLIHILPITPDEEQYAADHGYSGIIGALNGRLFDPADLQRESIVRKGPRGTWEATVEL